MTFSIAARCSRTGMLGVAVCTAVPGVGSLAPFVRAGVGAIATQSYVNPYLGIDGLHLLSQGLSAKQALERLLAADPASDIRQLSIVDARGRVAAHTGANCTPWFGHRASKGCAAAGNMLVDGATVDAMAAEFEKRAKLELPERLLAALEAGDATGGDFRGRQSAALLVFYREQYPYCDLRVDEHRHPVQELRRIFGIAQKQLFPFVKALPTRANPQGGKPDEKVLKKLLKHVDER